MSDGFKLKYKIIITKVTFPTIKHETLSPDEIRVTLFIR